MRTLAVLTFLIAAEATSSATILYNNTGSDPIPSSIGYGGGWGIQGSATDYYGVTSYPVAAQFTPTVDANLTEIDVYMESAGGYNQYVVLSIYTDNNGAPGTQIGGSWAIGALPVGTDEEVAMASGVRFTADTPYWLVASPKAANTVVNWTTTSQTGPYAFGFTKAGVTSWDVQPSYYQATPFFAIQGSLIAPEPGAIWLAAFGFVCLVCVRRRRGDSAK